jgi:hypothetical protein
MSFGQVEALIEQQNPKSVEETLGLLPKSTFDQYALVYSSRSLQGATAPNPRAIVYLKSGLTFAFNGDAKEDGFNVLEFMQFNQSSKKFEFHELSFVGGKPILSKPDTCLKCHGDNPHPIWDAYFFWPGVYGSEDAAMVGDETKNLSTWLASRPNHPRYKYLNLAASVFYGKTPDGHSADLGAQSVGMVLSRENFRALASDLSNDSKLHPFRYAMLAAGTCPYEPIEDFLPAELNSRARQSFQKMSGVVQQALQKSFQTRLDRATALDPSSDHEARVSNTMKEIAKGSLPPEFDAPSIIARYRYIVENFGSVTPNWSLEFKPLGSKTETYAIDDGYGVLGGLPDLWKGVLTPVDDAELYPLYAAIPSYPATPITAVCEKLKEKSLAALSKVKVNESGPVVADVLPSTEKFSQNLNSKPVFENCVQCHANFGSQVPQFPFNDFKALKEKLGDAGYPRGTLEQEILYRISAKGEDQMPPAGDLSPSEISRIKDTVESLSK